MVVADFGRWALKSTGRIRFFLLSSTYFLLEGPVLRIERRLPCHNFPSISQILQKVTASGSHYRYHYGRGGEQGLARNSNGYELFRDGIVQIWSRWGGWDATWVKVDCSGLRLAVMSVRRDSFIADDTALRWARQRSPFSPLRIFYSRDQLSMTERVLPNNSRVLPILANF
jgi:hypothetical protein